MSHDQNFSSSSSSSSSSASASKVQLTADTGMSRYNALVQGRVVDKTRVQYERYLAKIIKHFEDKGKRWTIPLKSKNVNTLLEFFGNLASAKGTKGTIKAASTIGSYKSALKYGYDQQGCRLEEEIIIGLSQMMRGYRRDVAKSKQEGKMAVHEGNSNLCNIQFCLRIIQLVFSCCF
jgi:hypothetical protein